MSAKLIGIGTQLFVFDENRRVYPSVGTGARRVITGAPIYREHFRPLKVVGQTSRSWLLEHGFKAPKNEEARFTARALTGPELDEECWAQEHRYLIAQEVQRARPYTLREVARIVGYRPKEDAA
jgi:hypothetical protein